MVNKHGIEYMTCLQWHYKVIEDCEYALNNRKTEFFDFDNDFISFLENKPQFLKSLRANIEILESESLDKQELERIIKQRPKIDLFLKKYIPDIGKLKQKIENKSNKTKNITITVFSYDQTKLISSNDYAIAFNNAIDEKKQTTNDGARQKVVLVLNEKIKITETKDSLSFTYDTLTVNEDYALKKLNDLIKLRGFKVVFLNEIFNDFVYEAAFNSLDKNFKLLAQDEGQYDLFRIYYRNRVGKNNKEQKYNGILGDNKYSRIIETSKLIETPVIRSTVRKDFKMATENLAVALRNNNVN
ncbi:hypothetical protein D5B42_23260 [Salmonella enterica subsp. enterica serovar Oranienburg]|nr:hypothetical protein [Salmonella enterica subsp. enterica serovar Oranienburg]